MGLYKRLAEDKRERSREIKMRRMLSNGETPHLIQLNTISEIERYTVANDTERTLSYHKDIENWQDETVSMLKSTLSVRSASLASSIHSTAYTDNYGLINRLGFSFDRTAIYLHKGAGRGYGGSDGSQWTYVKMIRGINIPTGIIRHTDSESLNKLGQGGRTPFHWFDPIITKQLPKLIDISMSYFDTMIVDATKIYIEK